MPEGYGAHLRACVGEDTHVTELASAHRVGLSSPLCNRGVSRCRLPTCPLCMMYLTLAEKLLFMMHQTVAVLEKRFQKR